MSGIGWLVVKSTALTIVLGLLMFGWTRTVWAFTHVGGATTSRAIAAAEVVAAR